MQIAFRWEKSKKGPADMRQATASMLPATARPFSSETLTCIAPCTAAAGSGHSTATRTKSGAGVRGERALCWMESSFVVKGPSVTHLRAADLRAVDTGDGVYEVVGLINDHNLVLQFDPSSAPGRLVQEHLVGQHHQLQGKHTPPWSQLSALQTQSTHQLLSKG